MCTQACLTEHCQGRSSLSLTTLSRTSHYFWILLLSPEEGPFPGLTDLLQKKAQSLISSTHHPTPALNLLMLPQSPFAAVVASAQVIHAVLVPS
jgi:hypothetical protein